MVHTHFNNLIWTTSLSILKCILCSAVFRQTALLQACPGGILAGYNITLTPFKTTHAGALCECCDSLPISVRGFGWQELKKKEANWPKKKRKKQSDTNEPLMKLPVIWLFSFKVFSCICRYKVTWLSLRLQLMLHFQFTWKGIEKGVRLSGVMTVLDLTNL